jgi:hypothetical protein
MLKLSIGLPLSYTAVFAARRYMKFWVDAGGIAFPPKMYTIKSLR